MHDLERIRQDLQESLSLDKHPVALLVGAGCPVSIRVPNAGGGTDPLIPDVAGLTEAVARALAADRSFCVLVEQFKEDGKNVYTIEDLLSHVRLLARIVGGADARGLDAKALKDLEDALCRQIVASVRRELPEKETPYHHLADWIGGVPRKSAIDLFTTNYDLLLEQALEDRDIPFFDGFVGARKPFFDLRAIEDDPLPSRWARIWKLHGSVNWRLRSAGRVVRSDDDTTATGDGILIHPSELKYDQSRRMPYLAMIDRLRHCLRQPSAFIVTVGYSYTDEHLNEVLLQGLRSNPKAAAFGLLYKSLVDEPGAKKVSERLPRNLTLLASDIGVVRGVAGPWLSDPSAGASSGPVTNSLGDFVKFAAFLKALCARADVSAHA